MRKILALFLFSFIILFYPATAIAQLDDQPEIRRVIIDGAELQTAQEQAEASSGKTVIYGMITVGLLIVGGVGIWVLSRSK